MLSHVISIPLFHSILPILHFNCPSPHCSRAAEIFHFQLIHIHSNAGNSISTLQIIGPIFVTLRYLIFTGHHCVMLCCMCLLSGPVCRVRWGSYHVCAATLQGESCGQWSCYSSLLHCVWQWRKQRSGHCWKWVKTFSLIIYPLVFYSSF